MKIFILGGPGSGKTTIAKKISDKYKIPFYELDKLFYDSNKKQAINDEKDREKIIDQFVGKNDWVSEGVYRQSWLNKLLKNADYVFILKIPKRTRSWRTTKRTFKQILGLEGYRPANLRLIFDFLKFNNVFEKERYKEIDERLNSLNIKPTFVKSFEEIEKFINKS